jgi:hypothetical protein
MAYCTALAALYPKGNPRGATVQAAYQTVMSELDARLARAYRLGTLMTVPDQGRPT